MLDPANDLLPPPLSPTNSSLSSSDLDTESTGSFFHDRSTTLGTLMGVSFPAITFRAPSTNRQAGTAAAAGAGECRLVGGRRRRTTKKRAEAEQQRRRRRWWWRLCIDEEARPSSLGEFLEAERKFGDGAFYGAAAVELEGGGAVEGRGNNHVNGRLLFAEGRVLPPAPHVDEGSSGGGICKFPVSLGGICNAGV